MRSGPLRHRCVLMREQTITRPGGGLDKSWVEVGKLWAEIAVPTGRVEAVANQIRAVVSAEIRVRYRPGVFAGMRLVRKTNTYLIGAALPDNDHTMLRLLCSNVVNP